MKIRINTPLRLCKAWFHFSMLLSVHPAVLSGTRNAEAVCRPHVLLVCPVAREGIVAPCTLSCVQLRILVLEVGTTRPARPWTFRVRWMGHVDHVVLVLSERHGFAAHATS